MRSIVVAYDYDRTIGREGALPWQGMLPADMQHFKELTEGTSVIMGRKTYESLPERFRPLPNRQNIVVSLSQKAIEGVIVANSLGDAFSQADHDIMVIGGAEVYRQALPLVNRVYATEILARTEHGDAFFPELTPDEWQCDAYEAHKPDEVNHFAYSFATYLRRNPIDS